MKSLQRAPSVGSLRALLLFAFFLSGGVGLAYEIALTRGLLRVLGSTAATSAVVLATFVGGLGLGARWGGRRVEAGASPLALYGVLEIAAAALALLALPLTGWLAVPYAALATLAPSMGTALRVLVAGAVVLPMAFLLGATLPALISTFTRDPQRTAHHTAYLYGINTLGAVSGCLWAGFTGVRGLGVDGVLLTAAAVGAGLGVLALVLARRGAAPTPVAAQTAASVQAPLALSAAFLCGLIGLGIEVVGFRLLVFFLEGFTATFASMLGVFILGLGAGSVLLGPRLVRAQRPARALGVLFLLVSGALALTWWLGISNLEDAMRAIRGGAYAEVSDPASIRAALSRSALLGAALVLFVPAFLLGPTFAMCVVLAQRAGLAPGHAVGRVYLFNSVGALTAPLLFGFVLMPLLHVPGAWWLLVALSAGAGIGLVGALPGRAGAQRLRLCSWAGLALGMGALALGLLPGAPEDILVHTVVQRGAGERTLLAAQTDEVTTASVIQRADGERILYTDDFAAAATGQAYRYMRMLGHLPVLLAKDPENAMVIAFGTGTTAGAVAVHPEVKRLEVVEVSQAVLELAPFFEEANRNVLKDPRVRVLRDDGRNALLLHAADLDVITLEPLMPYSPAGLPFYTREFYELARDRLREGGVLCQWVPVHAMTPALYAALLRTFFEVFPEGSLWFFEQSTALIGRRGAEQPPAESFAARAHRAASDLRAAGFDSPAALAGAYVAQGSTVLQSPTPPGGEASWRERAVRDLDPYPEFEPTPRASLRLPYLHQTLEYLATLCEPLDLPQGACFWPPNAGQPWREAARLALLGRTLEARGDFAAAVGGTHVAMALDAYAEALSAYDKAVAVLGEDGALRARALGTLRKRTAIQVRRLLLAAEAATAQGLEREALDALELAETQTRLLLAPVVQDDDPMASGAMDAVVLRLTVLMRLGRCAEAQGVLDRALLTFSDPPQTLQWARLAGELDAHLERGQEGEAQGPAWLIGARACRVEGIEPVRMAAQLLTEALEATGQDARLRTAARRLLEESRTQGVLPAAAEFVRGLTDRGASAPERGAQAHAVLIVLLRRLDEADTQLDEVLEAGGPGAGAALVEAAHARLLSTMIEQVDRQLASPRAPLREALARAIGIEGGKALMWRLATLLTDAEASVRTEASAALFTQAPDLAQEYDPLGNEAQRLQMRDRLRLRYGP